MVIKGVLTVVAPQPVADACDTAREIWDLLAHRLSLPPITEQAPYSPHLVWFGMVDEAIFFVTPLRRTERGFTCQISIFPHGKIQFGFSGWVGWIKRNLLLDRPMEKIEWEEGKGWTYHTETGISFTFKDAHVRLTD